MCYFCLQSKRVPVLKMEAAIPSKTFVNFNQTTYTLSHCRRHLPLKWFLGLFLCSVWIGETKVLVLNVIHQQAGFTVWSFRQETQLIPGVNQSVCIYVCIMYLYIEAFHLQMGLQCPFSFVLPDFSNYLSFLLKTCFILTKINLLLSLEKLAQSMTLALHILCQNLPSHSVFNTVLLTSLLGNTSNTEVLHTIFFEGPNLAFPNVRRTCVHQVNMF
jgi:hypothetical protein